MKLFEYFCSFQIWIFQLNFTKYFALATEHFTHLTQLLDSLVQRTQQTYLHDNRNLWIGLRYINFQNIRQLSKMMGHTRTLIWLKWVVMVSFWEPKIMADIFFMQNLMRLKLEPYTEHSPRPIFSLVNWNKFKCTVNFL